MIDSQQTLQDTLRITEGSQVWYRQPTISPTSNGNPAGLIAKRFGYKGGILGAIADCSGAFCLFSHQYRHVLGISAGLVCDRGGMTCLKRLRTRTPRSWERPRRPYANQHCSNHQRRRLILGPIVGGHFVSPAATGQCQLRPLHPAMGWHFCGLLLVIFAMSPVPDFSEDENRPSRLRRTAQTIEGSTGCCAVVLAAVCGLLYFFVSDFGTDLDFASHERSPCSARSTTAGRRIRHCVPQSPEMGHVPPQALHTGHCRAIFASPRKPAFSAFVSIHS
jgi:hypothetical protein